jgi:hypothetical protein
MREDMAHVIVERPRIIDGRPRKGRARPLEEYPKQLGMRRSQRERGGDKSLNENLAPLRRFLERQVGRPWDKVFAEIAARLRADSTVQQHVRDHLKDFVAIKPRRGISSWRWGGDSGLWRQPLYVDPRDGVLKRTDRLPEARRWREARKRANPPVERIELSAARELRRIDGIWYDVSLAPLPEPEYRSMTERERVPLKRYQRNSQVVEMNITRRRLVSEPVFDIARRVFIPLGPAIDEHSGWRRYRRDHPDRRYAVAKRQLSRKELRRHGLENRWDERT